MRTAAEAAVAIQNRETEPLRSAPTLPATRELCLMLQISFRTTSRKTPARRDASVKCAMCGHVVPRCSRQQRFCSDTCRKRAFAKKGHGAFIFDALDQSTGRATNPHKNLNDVNALHTAKSRSRVRINGHRRVLEHELVADREWSEVVSPDGVRVHVTRMKRRRL
jgi:hypothetical protein